MATIPFLVNLCATQFAPITYMSHFTATHMLYQYILKFCLFIVYHEFITVPHGFCGLASFCSLEFILQALEIFHKMYHFYMQDVPLV